MATPDREDIQIISRHSNLPETAIRSAFREFVYSGKNSWQQFLRIFFLSLGAGFMIAGIIFFFAYNWDALNKFVKLGIMEALIILLTLTALFIRTNMLLRKFLLTAAAMLVGVLFAVFGQVYQTGANAYDLFLNWTLCITLWVIIANFAPLWLVWIALINATVSLYLQQSGREWPMMTAPLLLYLVNGISLIIALLLKHFRSAAIPAWFAIVLALAAATIATISISTGIFDRPDAAFTTLLAIVILSYLAGAWYGYKQQSIFYLAVTGCSVIIMLCAGILKITDSSAGILFICVFIAGSITLLITSLLSLQKKWHHENAA